MAGSLLFSATTSRLTVPNTLGLRPGTGGFALAWWFKPDSSVSAASIIQGGSSSVVSYTMYRASPTQLNVYVQSAGASAIFSVPVGRKGAWTRFFVTLSDDRKVRLYRDGVLVGTSAAIAAWNITTTNPSEIGSTTNGLAALAGSSLADLSFYKGTVPTDDEVAADYFDGVQAPGCVHRYLLTEGAGLSAADAIAGNTATLGGAVPPTWRTDAPSRARPSSSARDTTSTARTTS